MKRCFKCNETKPLDEFYSHPMTADRHLNKCKTCTRRDVKARADSNIEASRLRKRTEARQPNARKCQAKATKAWRKRNPDLVRAQGRAHRAGLIAPEKCQRCSEIARLEKHHHDYSLPLAVEWLCKPCHVIADVERRHREQGMGGAVA